MPTDISTNSTHVTMFSLLYCLIYPNISFLFFAHRQKSDDPNHKFENWAMLLVYHCFVSEYVFSKLNGCTEQLN